MSSKKDNDSLEDFFRKATGHYNLDFNEGDWQKMEKMLDEEQEWGAAIRKQSVINRSGAVTLLFTLVALTVLFWLPAVNQDTHVEGSGQPAAITAPEQLPNAVGEIGSLETDASAPFAGGAQEPGGSLGEAGIAAGSKSIREGIQDEATSIVSTVVPGERKSKQAQDSPGVPAPDDTGESKVEISVAGSSTGMDGRDPGVEKNTVPVTDLAADRKIESDFNQLQTDPMEKGREKEAAQASAREKGVEDQVADSASAVEKTVDALEAESAGMLTGDALRSRWSLSLVAAPDFSRTARGGPTSTGDAYGLIVHYQVFERWSISTGLVLTSKNYWGYGDEYHPPKGYWNAVTNGMIPERIDGTCAMVEAPISMSFTILETGRSRLFVSAGLSSYFMRNEAYDYTFESPNPGAATGWSTDKRSSLWFGIGNMSVGYDFRATRSLSFGVEPYYRIPFVGVGWADIDLYSTGILIAARYRFFKQDKDPPTLHAP